MRCCASNLFGSSPKINSQPLIGGALSPVRSDLTTHTLLMAVYFLAFATMATCLGHDTPWVARHILYDSLPSTVWPRPTTQNASSNHKWRKEVSCTVHSRQPSSVPWYVLRIGCSEAELYALVGNKTETRCLRPQCANRNVECDTEVSIFYFF